MGEPVVKITNLFKRFGDVDALKNLSLEFNRGELFSLVGPDGAGKTTLMKILCGIIPPTSGKVRIFDSALDRDFSKIIRHIGYLSQGFSLYGDLTVDENIEFFSGIYGVSDYAKRREELLEFTRLRPFRTRLADKLSGGMKKKLALACTLVHNPLLVFLDEPTTGVDPVSRRDFWVILASLLKGGITIVMTTPYLDEAERSTRVGLLNGGKLLVVGGPGEIKSMMKGTIFEVECPDVWRAFTALKRHARSGGSFLQGPRISETNIIDIQVSGDRLHVVAGGEGTDFRVVRGLFEQEGIAIEDWRVVEPSIENVFMSLLRRERRNE